VTAGRPASASRRVSAIVIFLNAERFFEAAIESVLTQDFDDWELLLVDDGSTDGTTEMAQRYAERDPERIRYVTHEGRENRGMSASRNLGVREARGEYVAFLDADDTWLPGKLSRQVAILDSYPTAAMAYGPTLRWYSWEGETADEPREFPLAADRVIDPPHLLRWLLQRQAIPAMGSVLARRQAVLDVGGFENEFRTLFEDQVFHVKMFLRHPVFVSSECWDRYRKHRDSSCAVAVERGEYDRARRRFLEFVERYLVRGRCRDAEIWSLLRRELRALPRDPAAAPRPVVERVVARAIPAVRSRRAATAVATARAAARAGLTAARAHRRVTGRTLEHARRNGATTVVRIPTSLISDEYGFSLAPRGWHYLRSLLAEYERDPAQDPAEMVFFRFFTHERVQPVRFLDDVLFLHRPEEQEEDGFRFFFGTYPWGDWTASDARVGGNPFGAHFDATQGRQTRDLYGYRRNPWYRLGDDYPLRIEWRRTVEIYRSLRDGYRPSLYGDLPSVVLLVRRDGDLRAVRYRGHHRLATLAHLGHDVVTVALHSDSIKLVHESEVERWYYVRHGLCSAERALRIFDAFFELDGSERLEFLGLPRSY
jgi:glycosyltransferase involved in cell wall biosynthesis